MDIVNKDTGITMGELIKEYKQKYPYINKVCFCGRLDPMARGQVLLLLNESCKKMPDYLDKDKVYQFEIILGITTVSTDFMGYPSYHFNIKYDFDIVKQQIIDYMDKINGTEFEQEYHCYSSKRVDGEPLWKISKYAGVYPQRFHKVTLYSYKHIEDKIYDYKLWRDKNMNIVKNVKGDFSQKSICIDWNLRDKDRNNNTIEKINSIKFEIKTSSGFYVRQLVKDISRHIKLDLLCYDINRTKIIL